MRVREVDIAFSEDTGIGRVYVTDNEDLVKITIDKTPRGQQFGVLTHASLTEAQAVKLRNALDAWLHRNDPAQSLLPIEPTR